jgi:tetratricopeptide (TPR) repeat protein
MHCPQCSNKVEPETILCPRCGMEEDFPSSSERVCDVFLMGFSDPSSTDPVIEFLLRRSFWDQREELLARLSDLPSLLTKEMTEERARALRDQLEALGAIIEFRVRRMQGRGAAKKPVGEEEEEGKKVQTPVPASGGKGYLILFLISLVAVVYLAYQHDFSRERKTVERAVRHIRSHFPQSKSIKEKKVSPVESAKEVKASGTHDPEGVRLNNEGVSMMDQGRYEEAARLFQQALDRIPDEAVIVQNLERAWIQQGYQKMENKNYEEAILAFEEAVKVLDQVPEVYKLMGIAALNLSDAADAEQYFKTYLTRVAQDPEVERMLGELLYKQNRLEEGISYLKSYLAANPDDEKVRELLAKAGRESAAEEGFATQQGDHFDVRYDGPENIEAGYLVSGLLDEAYQRIGAELNYYPSERLTAILYSDDDFRTVTQSPDWTKGVYDGKIRIPIGGLKEKSRQLERVISHEYTHAVLHDMTGGSLPTWLNEGLAQYFEGAPLPDHERNARYILQNRDFIPLRDLEGSFLDMGGETASLAYTESLTVVDCIIQEHGFYAIQKILNDLANGEDLESALTADVGTDYAGLQEEWLQYLAKKYP